MDWEQKDIVNAILVGLTVIISYAAFRVARRQADSSRNSAKADVKMHAARKLSESVYKVRDEMKYCRAQFISSYEHSSPMGTWDEREKAFRQVLSTRWKPVVAALNDLETASREAEALLGSDVRTKVEALQHCARELYAGIDSFIANEASRGEDFKQDREFGKRIRATVFASPDDADNELNKSVKRTVADIDAILAPYLRH